jgi:FlaA1/EpsC-like NDP-sugar epimerase
MNKNMYINGMNNKRILIIGGTGALGKTLIKRYVENNEILVLSRDEHKHVDLGKEYVNAPQLTFRIGDVKDINSLRNAIEDYKPHVVINTAALKHVPICESNPYESVNVNIQGHQNLIQSVKRSNHRIETLMFISTDKACAPINVYGMCKAISERLYIDYANQQNEIKVCLVRYGNVLESTGSVIPYFKKLLNEGATKLPITDMRMTRFLLTLDRACDLIDFAYTQDTHGCICIPKVYSFSIPAIAKALFTWKGIDGELEEVGIRPGEKLHEAMISEVEWMRTLDWGDNYLITDDIVTTESKSYNSFDALMDDYKVYEFLQKSGVI